MSELEIHLYYSVETATWDAMAMKDGSVEYDSGGHRPKTPEAALYVLALTLYKELDAAS